MQDLLATTHTSHTDAFNSSRVITGLDIGVGASCIYSLLACATSPWRMFGTDIDAHSLQHAQANVNSNNLSSRIKLHQTSPSDPLVPLDKLGDVDFVICNPPFYSSEEDMSRAYYGKDLPPSAVCTGSTNEMICPGGDVGFVERIMAESLVLREKVQWYSSMLGRLASAQQLVAKLREHGITNFAVTNLKAGHKTRRWAVAWSFRDLRPSNAVARHGALVQALLPMATEWTVDLPAGNGELEELGKRVDGVMRELDVRWRWREDLHTGVAFVKENVWSRSARRKRKFQQQQQEGAKKKAKGGNDDDGGKKGGDDESDSSSEEEDGEPIALAVKIVCSQGQVNIRWLRGTDFTLWESFCGMLKRALGAREVGAKSKMEE